MVNDDQDITARERDVSSNQDAMAQEAKPSLHSSSYLGDLKGLQEILSGTSYHINATDKLGRTALHLAATKGHVDIVKELIKVGADVDKQDEHGNTAIHEAVWRGFSETAEELCRAKANVYIKNKGSFAPLHLACQNGHNQSCRILLISGCKPDIKNSYGDTAIHTSARYGHAGTMRILISAKANVNECNKNGDTGLHIAAAMCKRKLTKILLEAGCNQDLKNKQGEKSVDIADRKEFTEVAEILRNPPPRVIDTSEKEANKSCKKRGKESGTSRDSKDSGSRHKDKNKKNKSGHRVKFSEDEVKHHKKCIYKDKHGEVSPYGCHYYPSLTSFPSPNLDSLPSDPLQKGEQYFLDLAGNIKKGPVGIGYACYCIPFFQQVEKKLEADKMDLMDHIESTHEDLNDKISSLERRTRNQLFNLTQTMKEKLAGEKGDCLERVERRTLKERLELEKQQLVAADYIRTELKSWVQAKIDHLRRNGAPKLSVLNSSSSKKDELSQSNELARSKSEEILTEVINSEDKKTPNTFDYSNLGAKPKYLAELNNTTEDKGDDSLTVNIPNASPNSESGYGSPNRMPDGVSTNNQPDILSMQPISHNTVGLPNGDANYRDFSKIPEPEFRITRQFFDTVSNQMEKWYERRLSSMEKKTEERSENDRVTMRNRIQAIEEQLTNMTPDVSGNSVRKESAASLV